jgi:hypothetical protein
MAAGSRTLKLSILGDVDQLKKSLTSGATDVESFGSKLGDFGKKAGLAFAAAGAAAALYAGKFLIEATKNAAEDAKAQRNLALTLENTTNATNGQISAIEKWITQTSLAYGVTDDQLRPAFERLTRSTKDTQKSQELLNLAINISAATSKPLEAVTAALAKAYDGNAASLGKLGLGVDQSILKSKDFDAITSALRENFAGFADQEANTFEGKLRRLQLAFDEGKETIGSYVLDGITPLVDGLVETVIPAITNLSDTLGETLGPQFEAISEFIQKTLVPVLTEFWTFITNQLVPLLAKTLTPILGGLKKGFDFISDSIMENKDEFASFFEVVKVAAPIIGNLLGAAFTVIGKVASIVLNVIAEVLAAIKPLLNTAIDGINLVIRGLNLIKTGPDIGYLSKIGGGTVGAGGFSGTTPGGQSFEGNLPAKGGANTGSSGTNVADIAAAAVAAASGKSNSSNVVGGNFNPGQFRLGEAKSMQDFINFDPNRFSSGDKNNGSGNNYTINVTGAIDPIGVSRQIVNLLNNEATLSGTFDNLGGSRLVATL